MLTVTNSQNTLVCDECGEAALLPSQPLQLGADWTCTHCNHAIGESTVKERVSELLAELKHLTVAERYNVDKWLHLDQRAALIVHPQHEVMQNITKILFVLPRFRNWYDESQMVFYLID
jgi:hypothetical protein